MQLQWARALRVSTVAPAMPATPLAIGILQADAVRDYSQVVMLPGDAFESAANYVRYIFAITFGDYRHRYAAITSVIKIITK